MHNKFFRVRVRLNRQPFATVWLTALLLTVFVVRVAAQVAGEDILAAGNGADVFVEHLKTVAVPLWSLTFAAMCAAVLLLAWSGVGNGSKRGVIVTREGPQLPDALRTIAVFGKRYTLEIFTGKVKEARTGLEADGAVTQTVGGTSAPASHWQMPWARRSKAISMAKADTELITLGYSDGGRETWEFSTGQLHVAHGELLSFVVRHNDANRLECLIAYNHDNARFNIFNFRAAHAIARLPTWLVATVVGTFGAIWGWRTAAASFLHEVAPGTSIGSIGVVTLVVGLCAAAVVALVPYMLAEILLPGLRTMLFRKRCRARLEHFLEGSTLDAKRIFPIEWIPQPRTATSDLFYKPM